MDLREVNGQLANRHPWELSRTASLLHSISESTKTLHSQDNLQIINIGAGDCYFDQRYLEHFPEDKIFAVDTGYKELSPIQSNILRFSEISQLSLEDRSVDMIWMMDSLEYMPNDRLYLSSISRMLKPGGLMVFTLPAFQFLFSDHDLHVENLRRYSIKSFNERIKNIPSMHIISRWYFYFSLFIIRLIQVGFHIPIDKEIRITTGWQYREDHILTKAVTGLLSLDYEICKLMSKIGIFIPGLSLFVICEKKEDDHE